MTISRPTAWLTAPAWLELSLMRQEKPTIAHLVNHHGNRPYDRNFPCVEQVLPVHGVTLELACPAPRVCVPSRIPRVDIHTAVVVV